MKSKYLTRIIIFLIAISWLTPVQAKDDNAPNVIDDANLLSEGEMEYLEKLIDALGTEYDIDTVILTIDDNLGKSLEEYAEMFYTENQYGYGENKDGMLFIISTETYDWRITTWGYCSDIIDDEHYAQLETNIIPLLEETDYNKALVSYLMELNGVFKDHTRPPAIVPEIALTESDNSNAGVYIAAIVASISAFIIVSFQKRRFQKKYHLHTYETDTIIHGSFQLIKQEDTKKSREIMRDE